MKAPEVGPTLRAVSALRTLCLSLPHVPTPAEARHLERFATFTVMPELAGPEDVDTLLAGWRQWWRGGRTGDLLAMATGLAPDLLASDRRLVMYLLAAREASPPA